MTIAIKPSGTADVRARREAALERINGGPKRTTRSGDAKRAKPSRRVVQRREPKFQENLGPTPGLYYWIGLTVAAFVMLGLVMVLSATSAREVASSDTPYATFTRQAGWAVVGLLGLLVALKVPYQRWRSLVIPGAVLSFGLMMLPFVPGVGVTVNDANSWVRFGGFGFQPSEFLKLAAIAFLADHFTRHEHDLHLPRHGLWPLALVAGGCAGISFLQGDLGAAIVLTAVSLAVGLIAGVPFRHVGIVAGVGMTGAAIAVMSSPWRFNRFTAFRDIEGNKEHLAFQSWQGLLSIANGGWTGSGIGGSRSKLGYLPYAHSDFIFAVIADELGFIGSVAVIGGFGLIVWFGFQAALASPDRFGMLLAGGIACWFGIQAIVNIGGVAGVMPVTGLTLPFFSAGGTSLFVSMVAAGLLLNVARRAITAPRTSRPITKGRRPSRPMVSRA
jgi:cell division protein FtsW